MFNLLLSEIGAMSVAFVRAKYPEEFVDPAYKHTIFELVELVGDDLSKRNFDVISKPYFDTLASVKDIAIGDRNEWVNHE